METIGSVGNEFSCQVLNGMVYYVNSLNNGLYKVGTAQFSNPGAKAAGMKIEGGYLVCTFQEEASNPYCMMIFDKNGKIVFKTSDVRGANTILTGKGKLYFMGNVSNNVYITEFS